MSETTPRRTRGKQKIDPALRDLHMQRIADARARLWGAKAEFEARKKREWGELKATLERDTYQTVWEARDANLIIDDIKSAYGVSNASVIYNVLKARPNVEATVREAAPAAVEPYTWAPDATESDWLVTETETGHQAVVSREGRPLRSLDAGALALAMYKPDHPAWGYKPEN